MGCGLSNKQKIFDLVENVKNNRNVVMENLSLSEQAYFDIIELIKTNENIVSFKMKNCTFGKLLIKIVKKNQKYYIKFYLILVSVLKN